MLTCEDIAERAKQIAPVITRGNYRAVATAIHPHVHGNGKPASDNDTPEWREYRRGATWKRSDDWTDMVVNAVTLWQYRAAQEGC